MRLDKFIWNLGYWSRKKVHEYIKNWYISVNQEVTYEKDKKINFWDLVSVWNEEIEYKKDIYVILNKPSWYVSSTKNEWWHKSYLELLSDCPYSDIINIVGRLDFDTTWLLFLTNDWELTHKIINPKKDIFKKYLVWVENELDNKDIEKLESGVKVDLWEKDSYISKPAIVEKVSEKEIFLSISEGKFHQVKNMLEAVWNKVISLKRVSIWNLELSDLKEWEWRYLSDEEVISLKNHIN
jgi:16S rRNA pseudouridine516 synthase